MSDLHGTVKEWPNGGRDYAAFPTSKEKADIAYIVQTLANKPPLKLLAEKKSLDAAGARVRHVHPFRFLEVIFLDEPNKVAIRNMSGKSWVWKTFSESLFDTFDEETKAENLQPHVAAFAAALGLSKAQVAPLVRNQRWNALVELLLRSVPRSGNPSRYDM